VRARAHQRECALESARAWPGLAPTVPQKKTPRSGGTTLRTGERESGGCGGDGEEGADPAKGTQTPPEARSPRETVSTRGADRLGADTVIGPPDRFCPAVPRRDVVIRRHRPTDRPSGRPALGHFKELHALARARAHVECAEALWKSAESRKRPLRDGAAARSPLRLTCIRKHAAFPPPPPSPVNPPSAAARPRNITGNG
jgi:hypothetical protein